MGPTLMHSTAQEQLESHRELAAQVGGFEAKLEDVRQTLDAVIDINRSTALWGCCC